jgi:hypothetical protein
MKIRLWWRYVARETLRHWSEKIVMAIAWKLPKRLVMWCGYRIGANATQGQFGNTVVPDLKFMDAMARWK